MDDITPNKSSVRSGNAHTALVAHKRSRLVAKEFAEMQRKMKKAQRDNLDGLAEHRLSARLSDVRGATQAGVAAIAVGVTAGVADRLGLEFANSGNEGFAAVTIVGGGALVLNGAIKSRRIIEQLRAVKAEGIERHVAH